MKKLILLSFMLFGITLFSACSKTQTKFVVLGFELNFEDKDESQEEFVLTDKV